MKGKLYVVGTPIGNLKDISKRALEVLNYVDFVLVEDTRVGLKLFNSFKIKKKLISYNEFSSLKKTQHIIEKLKQGENAALISDAGMPLICDPGQILVNQCHKNEIVLRVVPGPCALIAAVCLSGFNSCQFTFYGFLSTNNKNRKKALEFLKTLNHTIILYEAPHKLVKTLKDLLDYLKDREIIILKELTKIYESYNLTTLKNALEFYKSQKTIKGEFVLVLKGLKQNVLKSSLKEAVEYAKQLVLNGEKKTTAAKKAALLKNQSKSLIYKNIN